MLVVSREDVEAPRALAPCVPITSSFRASRYEVPLPAMPFLRVASFANVQVLQALQEHESVGPVGSFWGSVMDEVRDDLRFALNL